MVNKYNNKIYNYINYFTLACIVPLGYFAPIGEWLLLSFLSIATLMNCLINRTKINLSHLTIFLLAIFILLISYYWSINQDRTIEVIGPLSGIIFGIYIILNISSNTNIKSMDNLIGIPVILTSILILSEIVLNTEIRSSLAILVGDQPTSKSANYSRGIILLTIIMPLSITLYINNSKNFAAFFVLLLVSFVIFLGPNDSAKIALICSMISFLIIYFLGPKSFIYFGIVSIIFILCLPIIATKIFPALSHIDKKFERIKLCTQSKIWETKSVIASKRYHVIINDKLKNNKNILKSLLELEKLELGTPVPLDMMKLLNDNNVKCSKILEWQETPEGSSIIHRLLVWEYVGKKILTKPILGHGVGTSRLIGQNIILNIPNTSQEIKGAIPLHPHNNFLEIWLELGLIGIIIISFLWIKIIKLGINIRKNSYVIGTGVCTSIVTIFVISNLSFGVFQAWWMASVGLIFLVILQAYKYEEQQ